MKQNFDDVNVRDEINEQTTFAFFKNLHIDLNIAIEKRENFDATIDFETISVHDIDFRDVAIDENFDEITDNSIIDFDDTFSERSRTISDVNIERNKNFDDEKDEKMIDRDDETENEKIIDSKTNETTNSTNC